MLGGLLMAAVPVIVGIVEIIYLFKKYREEQSLADQTTEKGGAP